MKVTWLPGFADYDETVNLQERLVAEHQSNPGREPDLLLLEHSSVYTIGKTRDRTSLRDVTFLPYPVREINRGGQATYHGPGQLVGYPILNLDLFGRDLHRYVESLERTLIAACACWGVGAELKEGLVGVWVEDRKIASIGVGVKKWVSMHGFAINILPESLVSFERITPCGIQGVRMTCLESEMKEAPEQGRELVRAFGDRFAALWQLICEPGNNNE